MGSFVRASVLMLILVACAAPAFAQGLGSRGGGERVGIAPRSESETRTFGTASTAAQIVSGLSLLPPSSATEFAINTSALTGIAVFQTTAGLDWWAQVHLPAGALVERIELEACDESAIGDIAFGMASGTAPGGATQNLTAVGTTTDSPGLRLLSAEPDRADHGRQPEQQLLALRGLRHDGRYQPRPGDPRLLPAPGEPGPRGRDLPERRADHPPVSSGSSRRWPGRGSPPGCGPGAYCPDSPVTRGQMAVFLSIALGLHFPDNP